MLLEIINDPKMNSWNFKIIIIQKKKEFWKS